MRRNFYLGLLLILIVIGVGFYVSMPGTTSIFGRTAKVVQGLDLKGGVELTYQLDLSKTAKSDQSTAIQSTLNVINRRVDTLGVSAPVIQTTNISGNQDILVDLPGVKDINQAVNLIGQTAQLQFETEGTGTDSSGNPTWIPTTLTGKQLSKASVTFDQNTNAPQISLQFNSQGAQLFSTITGNNVGKPLAIFLDSQILSDPTVNEKISGGQAVITGQFTLAQAQQIASLLNAGALDVPIKLVAEQTVGATLGIASIKQSLVAGIIGLILVAIFMIMNYRLVGLMAVLALCGYSAVTLALFKTIPVTLTLAGIAGFILSIGMAVDANILIFERFREEIKKGKTVKIALEEGFRRAWPSVRDSNMATLITCAILFFTTTGLVKGFALTLAIGVVVSLFSSITTSRAFLRLCTFSNITEKWLART
jgi:preprotein translocase subunit SecD